VAAGFEEFEITWSEDVFEGAPRQRREIADFGTRGVNFRARRPDLKPGRASRQAG
jgi:hypothetical protein